MYEILVTERFNLTYKRVTKQDKLLQKRVQKAIKILRQDPFYSSLKTHKVGTKNHGEAWSSWVTGDIRII